MKAQRIILVCATSALFLGTLNSCKKKKVETGTPSYAQLELENASTASALTATCLAIPGGSDIPDYCWTPTKYALKMLAVYISEEEEGSRNAPAGLIWANTDCPTRKSDYDMGEGDDQKTIPYDVLDDCNDEMVTNYFDFARTSEVVNSDLNSQDMAIPPGTYNYVQMAFCMGSAKTKNLQFKADGMDAEYEISSNKCGVSSTKSSEPIVIGEGESVKVNLAYDIADIVYQQTSYKSADYCYISSDESVVRCIGDFRELAPTFEKK